jgi:hypothetical protein
MLKEMQKHPMYLFLMVLTIASAVGLQTWRTLFNNFAVEIANLEGYHIGMIQSFREIPGFLALLAVYLLKVLKEHHLSALSIIILGMGVMVTGFFPSYHGLLITTMIMSFGFHYYETTNQSLTLQYFNKTISPWIFGKLRSYAALSNIVIGAVIYLITAFLSYQQIYLFIGSLITLTGLWALRMDPSQKNLPVQHKRMVLRKKYWLFYVLTFLAGARRQIFVAFAVFLLVKKFHFSIQEITILFVLNNSINYFLMPYVGKAIMKFGERKILSLEYFSLIFIFTAYAFVDAKWIIGAMYVLDHIFFNFAIAIRTYFQKIGDTRDIAPTMAVGFTINHIAAVILPAVGGILWMIDYRIPFLAGAALSICSLIAVQKIKQITVTQEAL